MGILYLTEPGTSVHLQAGLLKAKIGDVELLSVPFEQVKGMIVYSGVNLTNNLTTALLEKAIPVTFLSSRGRYFGRLETVKSANVVRQLKQVELINNPDFCLNIAKRIIYAKIANSLTVIKEFARHHPSFDLDYPRNELPKIIKKISVAESIETLIGYEGMAAKIHFDCLNMLTKEDFKFRGRSRNPPKDPFNSMLSYGYTLLMFDIYTLIQMHGLNPYFGFLHKPRNGHAALASDLMELWRPVLVDSFVLHLANRNSFHVIDFETDSKGGVYLNNEKSKLFVKKYEERIKKVKKTPDGKDEFNYRLELEKQILLFVQAVEKSDPEEFQPYFLK